MLFSGVSAAIGGHPPEPFELPAATPPEARDLSFERYAVIQSRDLFTSARPGSDEPIVDDVLPPSKAEWRLIGTVAMSDPKLALATLEHKRNRGLRGAWHTGEDIEPGLSLVRIEPRRVVVLRDGKREQIPMDEELGPLAGADGARAQSPAAAGPSPGDRREAARQERVDQMAQQREQQRLEELRVQAEAEAAAQAAAQPVPGQQRIETLFNNLRMTPVQDQNGELSEIIVDLNPDSTDNPFPPNLAGARCHTLNGIPVSRMHEAISTMSDDQQACLQCTLTDGSSQTICY
jgi:hypothetical protein